MSAVLPRRLALLLVLAAGPGCVLVDRPMLALRSVAGGLHNARQVSGLRPFFLPDGRLGVAANGALVLEREPGGALVSLADPYAEIDDPDAAPDGGTLVFTSGRELVSAGGGHKDHVFQLYALELSSGAWRRLSCSRRAEALPRFTSDGAHIVFVRRAEYDGWSLDDPWGPGSIFVAEADGSRERRLTEGLFHPFSGLELVAGDSRIVFGARPEGRTRPAVFELDFPAGGAPRVLLEDAYLPTPIPGTEELLVARVHADGHRLARVDRAGGVLAAYAPRAREFLGLCVAPDGSRIVYGDFDPEGGQWGEYRLWSLAEGAREPRLLEVFPYRPAARFKPLDVLKPPSWFFRSGASPGSR
jgi:hypothetical protein